MEERIIDEEIGRKIRVKKMQDGTTDVVDELSENENADGAENAEDGEVSEEEFAFELPEMEEDDEDLVGLSPEEALALRQKKAEEEAARKAEYAALVAAGEEELSAGDFTAAEATFEKALLLDDEATAASVGYWRAKTEDFENPDVLIDEYLESGFENLEFDLGYQATELIKEQFRGKFARRYDELIAEEEPLTEKVLGAQERRRAILKPRRKKSALAFGISSAAFLGSLAATAVFAMKNFTVKGDSYLIPTIVAGVASAVVFGVFGVFTNKFVNACRIYRANEKLSSTEDGARLEEILEYKDLYEKFL